MTFQRRRFRSDSASPDTTRIFGPGAAVRVVEGGAFEWQNKLRFGRGNESKADAKFADSFLPCVPGNVASAPFDFIELETTVAQDEVVLEIWEEPPASLEPSGICTRRALFRSEDSDGVPAEESHAAEASSLLWDSEVNGFAGFPDGWRTHDHHDVRLFWDGWVIAETNFGLWITVRSPDSGSTFRPLQVMLSHKMTVFPVWWTPPFSGSHAVNFTPHHLNQSQTQAGGAGGLPFPPYASVRVYIIDMGGAVDPWALTYSVGVRGGPA